jgi:hypothetical protein
LSCRVTDIDEPRDCNTSVAKDKSERRQAHRPRKCSQQPNQSPCPLFQPVKRSIIKPPLTKRHPHQTTKSDPQPTVPFAGTWTMYVSMEACPDFPSPGTRPTAHSPIRLSHLITRSPPHMEREKKGAGVGKSYLPQSINRSFLPPESYKKRERDRNSALPQP